MMTQILSTKEFRSWGLWMAFLFLVPGCLLAQWNPPSMIPREDIIKTSQDVLSMLDNPAEREGGHHTDSSSGNGWDVGGMVFEPEDSSQIPIGPDGKKVGIFMIHGGGGDHRGLIPRARLVASKFGIKVVTMTYPGQLYLLDDSRNWPGSTIHPRWVGPGRLYGPKIL